MKVENYQRIGKYYLLPNNNNLNIILGPGLVLSFETTNFGN